MPEAVIFDLDGVLVDSEQLWNRAKEDLVHCTGGRWRDDAPHAMMGMSLGPITGRLVSQVVAGEKPEIDLTLLAPDRFSSRRFK